MPSLHNEISQKVLTPDVALYLAAMQCAQGCDPDAAVTALMERVRRNPDMLRPLVAHYLDTRIAADMSGDALNRAGGGNPLRAQLGQALIAPARANLKDEAGANPGLPQSQSPSAPLHPPHSVDPGAASSALPKGHSTCAAPGSPVDDAGARCRVPEGHLDPAPASSPVYGGEGQPAGARKGQKENARPAVKPNPPRGLAAMALAQRPEDVALFRSICIRGKAIGDLTPYQATIAAKRNEREAAIVRHVLRKLGSHWPPGKTIAELAHPEWLREALESNAAEVAQ